MRAILLKAGATVLTVAATALSAQYVTSHLKNPSAPLQPTVINSNNGATAAVGPSVRPSDVQPVTSTYAS